jgi:OOP family OmpA-OmpF porin
MEFDESLFDDEDGDFILDIADRCPGTPYGIEVDSTGCPLDMDLDGVPDYLDDEPYSELGAWVDDRGVTITDEEFDKAMSLRDNAMPRDEVEDYMTIISGEYRPNTEVTIPEKFQSFDADGDGELSLEELMQAIDQYFDYQQDLDVDEIRQLNDFFFSQ